MTFNDHKARSQAIIAARVNAERAYFIYCQSRGTEQEIPTYAEYLRMAKIYYDIFEKDMFEPQPEPWWNLPVAQFFSQPDRMTPLEVTGWIVTVVALVSVLIYWVR